MTAESGEETDRAERHRQQARVDRDREGPAAPRVERASPIPARLPVIAVRVPEGISDAEIVALLRSRHGIVTGPGQGPLKGKIFRIGHLGWVEPLDVIRFFGALEMVLSELGYPVKLGAAVSAAEEVLLQP